MKLSVLLFILGKGVKPDGLGTHPGGVVNQEF